MRFGVLPIYGILESRLHQRFSKTQVAISLPTPSKSQKIAKIGLIADIRTLALKILGSDSGSGWVKNFLFWEESLLHIFDMSPFQFFCRTIQPGGCRTWGRPSHLEVFL